MTSGRELERLIGHVSSVLMLRRDLLCLLSVGHTFSRQMGEQRGPLEERQEGAGLGARIAAHGGRKI